MVAILVLLVPVALLIIDCVVLAIGASQNDSVCRDAARAAASGPPGDMSTGNNRSVASGSPPYKRAQSVIKRVWNSGVPAKVRDELTVLETIRDVPPPELGGPVDGEVSVLTVVDVYPPFIVSAFVGPAGMSFRSRHSVPYTYVAPRP